MRRGLAGQGDIAVEALLHGTHIVADMLDTALPGVDALDQQGMVFGATPDQITGALTLIGSDLDNMGRIELRDQLFPDALVVLVPVVAELILGFVHASVTGEMVS